MLSVSRRSPCASCRRCHHVLLDTGSRSTQHVWVRNCLPVNRSIAAAEPRASLARLLTSRSSAVLRSSLSRPSSRLSFASYGTTTSTGRPLPDVPDTNRRTLAYVLLAVVLAGSIVAAFNHRKLNASIVQSSYVRLRSPFHPSARFFSLTHLKSSPSGRIPSLSRRSATTSDSETAGLGSAGRSIRIAATSTLHMLSEAQVRLPPSDDRQAAPLTLCFSPAADATVHFRCIRPTRQSREWQIVDWSLTTSDGKVIPLSETNAPETV